MARTQLRLEQLTGSLGVNGNINDQLGSRSTGSIDSNSVLGIVNNMASAIKRIHGHDSFSEANSGVFKGDQTFENDVTIDGSLSVLGTTTTIDTANLVIEDRIIYLGSGSTGTNQVSAIAFASGSSTSDEALVFGPKGEENVLAAARRDVEAGTTTNYNNLFDNLVPIRASEFQIGDALTAITKASNDLVVSASNQGRLFLQTKGGAEAEGVSFTTGSADGQNAFLNIFKNGNNPTLSFDDRGVLNSQTVIDVTKGGGLLVSGSMLKLQHSPGADERNAAELRFYSGSSFTALRAGQVSSNTTFTLPTLDGSNNQVLVTDGSGNLSFSNTPISTTSGKSVAKAVTNLAANTTHVVTAAYDGVELSTKFNTIPNTDITGSLNVKLLDIFGEPDEVERIDVFVNGQLLLSGNDGGNVAAGADYLFGDGTSDGKLSMKFAFDLESDDILTIITK